MLAGSSWKKWSLQQDKMTENFVNCIQSMKWNAEGFKNHIDHITKRKVQSVLLWLVRWLFYLVFVNLTQAGVICEKGTTIKNSPTLRPKMGFHVLTIDGEAVTVGSAVPGLVVLSCRSNQSE